MPESDEELVKRLWENSTPQWTCEPWDDLYETNGVRWCAEHDLPLQIVALDGVSRICRIGVERDPYEFSMQIRRGLVRRGSPVRPAPWAPNVEEDIQRGNGWMYEAGYK